MSARNRDIVQAYYKALWSGHAEAAMADHLTPDYREHQASANFTRQGLAAAITARRDAYADHSVTIHHVLSDGDHVFLLVQESTGPGVDYARAELFRLEGGKIAEHWGSHVLDEKNRKNANGTFDGPQVDRTTDYAARYAEEFERLDDLAFNQHDLDAFHISRNPGYIQHSPKGRDGLSGLVEVLADAKQKGLNFRAKRLRTFTDGDFLVSHRIYDCDPPAPLMNHYTFDMFRISESGEAVEHWDVMEDAPAPGLLEKML